MITCARCGTQQDGRSRSCQFCGAPLAVPTWPNDPARSRHHDTPALLGRPRPAFPPAPSLPVKDPGTGLVLELLPAFCGVLGVGHLWAGDTALGLALLLGYWSFWGLVGLLTVLTFGLLLCFLPFFVLLYLLIPFASALLLQRRLLRRQRALLPPHIAPLLAR